MNTFQAMPRVEYNVFEKTYLDLIDVFIYPEIGTGKRSIYNVSDLDNIEGQIIELRQGIEDLIHYNSGMGLTRLKVILTKLIAVDFDTYIKVNRELERCLQLGIDTSDEHFWIITETQKKVYNLIRSLLEIFFIYYPDEYPSFEYFKEDRPELEILNKVIRQRRGAKFNVNKLEELYNVQIQYLKTDADRLPGMFTNRGDLEKLNSLLNQHGFIYTHHYFKSKETGEIINAQGKTNQFVAFVRVITPLLKKYAKKDISNALSSYYKFPFSVTLLKPSKRIETDKYKYIFTFLRDQFKVINEQWDTL